ncbi:MAG TPA: M67 family metallopeptidase [Thermoanaerobaculia bacterium]|nr:M67 family metallopeptidase [Thermoanaerobaculia bacterium]
MSETTTATTLRLPAALLERVREHGRTAYPEECCGVMLGRIDRASGRTEVVRLVAQENQREDEHRHNRYLISPEAVLHADREARTAGLEIVGYYHSHPDHPSRPSDFDRDHAWPDQSYLIVAVAGGQPATAQSWRLRDDRSAFEEETVEVPSPRSHE